MQDKRNWETIDEYGSKICAEVVGTTAVVNDSWRNELITLNLPNEVLNKLWLETAYFGVYLLQKKFTASLEDEKREVINRSIRGTFLLAIPTLFGDEKADNSDFKNYIASEYDRTLKLYENYKGVDVKMLFRDIVRDIFNTSEESGIKFIDNTRGNRFKLKTASILAAIGGNKEFSDQLANTVYLPVENLMAFASGATQAFANINESLLSD
jgi:hypothetical protein